jgi:enoyl-CoA hydratase/carnithine racemase
MSSELVLTKVEAGVLEITLNRAEKRNALSLELFEAVGEAFEQAADPQVRAVLLRGQGPVFCAGIDLNSLAGLAGDPAEGAFLKGVHHLQDIYMRLDRIGKPSVAAMQGAAVGAGLQLGLACDLRVAAEDLTMGLFEIHYGIVPDLGGLFRVVQLCGPARAKDLAMTGREVKPEEALRIGLVDRVVPAASLADAGWALARELAGKAPLAVRAIKRLCDDVAAGQAPGASLLAVAEAQVDLIAHPDFMEAVSARVQKREPVFSAQ